MSNNDAVNAYLERKRKDGFRTISFLIHEDDEEKVREFVNKLRSQREAEMEHITPETTIKLLETLPITDDIFKKVHHLQGSKGASETIAAHMEYLKNRSRYQMNRNNYVVALRLKSISSSLESGCDMNTAIDEAIKQHPFY
jgi:predicted CopG family antitoxin